MSYRVCLPNRGKFLLIEDEVVGYPEATPYRALRRRLIEARKEAGLTQCEVCEEMGKSTSFMNDPPGGIL